MADGFGAAVLRDGIRPALAPARRKALTLALRDGLAARRALRPPGDRSASSSLNHSRRREKSTACCRRDERPAAPPRAAGSPAPRAAATTATPGIVGPAIGPPRRRPRQARPGPSRAPGRETKTAAQRASVDQRARRGNDRLAVLTGMPVAWPARAGPRHQHDRRRDSGSDRRPRPPRRSALPPRAPPRDDLERNPLGQHTLGRDRRSPRHRASVTSSRASRSRSSRYKGRAGSRSPGRRAAACCLTATKRVLTGKSCAGRLDQHVDLGAARRPSGSRSHARHRRCRRPRRSAAPPASPGCAGHRRRRHRPYVSLSTLSTGIGASGDRRPSVAVSIRGRASRRRHTAPAPDPQQIDVERELAVLGAFIVRPFRRSRRSRSRARRRRHRAAGPSRSPSRCGRNAGSSSQRGTASRKMPPPAAPRPVMTSTQRLPPARAASDKAGERAMRLGLGHAVQVEPRLDRVLAALQPLGARAIDPGKAPRRRQVRRGRRRDGDARSAAAGPIRRAGGRMQRTGTPAQRGDIAHRLLPQRGFLRRGGAAASLSHSRSARRAAGAARARRAGCAARYRRCATGR